MTEEVKEVGNIEGTVVEVDGNCKKSKFKVLFCKWGMKLESGEVAERVWQFNTEFVDGSKPENRPVVQAINEFKKNVFGDLKPKFTRDANFFHGKEVYEVVVDPEIPEVFERAHWKNANSFKRQRFNPENFRPVSFIKRNDHKKENGQPMTEEEYEAFVAVSKGLKESELPAKIKDSVRNHNRNHSLGKLGDIVPDKDRFFQDIASDSGK